MNARNKQAPAAAAQPSKLSQLGKNDWCIIIARMASIQTATQARPLIAKASAAMAKTWGASPEKLQAHIESLINREAA